MSTNVLKKNLEKDRKIHYQVAPYENESTENDNNEHFRTIVFDESTDDDDHFQTIVFDDITVMPEFDGEDDQKKYFHDKMIKYSQLDKLCREGQIDHNLEMKAINSGKKPLEQFLLNYLDKVNENYFVIGNSKFTIREEITKLPLGLEDITLCLIDGFKEHKLCNNEDEIKLIVADLVKKIDSKSETKTTKYLHRTSTRVEKPKN